MLIFKAAFTIDADQRRAFSAVMPDFLRKTRAETGNITFGVYESTDTSNRFIVLGEFKDDMALDEHEAAAYTLAFRKAIRPMITQREPTMVFSISRADLLSHRPSKQD